MKQTAVEWLERRFYFTKGQLIDIDFEQAKQMEKERITTAYRCGKAEAKLPPEKLTTGEQYYNETFKSEQEQRIIDMMRWDEESGLYKSE